MLTAVPTTAEIKQLLTRNKRPGIYLAGAIDKVSAEFALGWRREATEALQDRYKIFDPTADKDLFQPDVNTTLYTPEHIVETDLDMIGQADIILAEMSRKDVPYHGTSMELVYGQFWGKRIYVWGGCQSYWVRYHATQIFEGLADAIDHIYYG